MRTSPETLFERYRQRGDVEALGEVFDRTAPALLRVALHLAGDPGRAEDLLQATFVTAIEAAGEWDRREPLVPWLMGILGNRARQQRWREGRRPDPARLPVREPEDPARTAERHELGEAVEAAIAGLPERYRSVLRLHLAYGHHPAEIAHALERPPGTVRSQLARGLALLRRMLPVGFTPAGAIAGTARGLGAVRAVVVEKAAEGAMAAAVGSVTGGVVMTKKVVGSVVAGVLACGLWWAWPRSAPPHRTAGPGAEAADARADVDDAAAAGPATSSPGQREEARAAARPREGMLRVTCRWRDGAAATGVVVQVVPPRGLLWTRTRRTEADGSASFAGLDSGSFRIHLDRAPGTHEVEVRPGHTTELELAIPAGIGVRGRVVDDHGRPVPRAAVWLSEAPHDDNDGRDVTRTAADGSFELRDVEPERFLSAHAPGRRAAVVLPVRGEPGDTVAVELVLEGAGVALDGLVLGPAGEPVTGASVMFGERFEGLRWTPALHGDHRPPRNTRTDARGRFRLEGLAPGGRAPLRVRAPGCCLWNEPVELPGEGERAVTVRLQRGATVTGTVTDRTDRPVAGALVTAYPTEVARTRALRGEFRGPAWAGSGAGTDAEGRYRIEHVPPGTLYLRARTSDAGVGGELAAAEGAAVTWNAVLEARAITGRVLDARGRPLPGWQVGGMPPRSLGNPSGTQTDEEGRFRLAPCADAPYRIRIRRPRDEVKAVVTLRGVWPGGEELAVRVPDHAIPGAFLEGRVLDPEGLPVAGATVVVHCEELGTHDLRVTTGSPGGGFRAGPLPAGRHRLEVRVEGRMPVPCGPWDLPRGRTLDVGDLRLPATGELRVVVREEGGRPREGVSLSIVGNGFSGYLGETKTGGRLQIGGLPPGAHRLRVRGEGLAHNHRKSFEVTATGETELELVVPKGVPCVLVHSPPTGPVPMWFRFEWTRNGTPFEVYDNLWQAHRPWSWPRRFLPGRYEVVVTGETGLPRTSGFVVRSSDPPGREIPVWLP